MPSHARIEGEWLHSCRAMQDGKQDLQRPLNLAAREREGIYNRSIFLIELSSGSCIMFVSRVMRWWPCSRPGSVTKST